MAKKSPQSSIINETGLIIPLSFFVLFAINALVIAVANSLFPEHVVLGNATITRTWAIIHSMSTLALINTFLIPVVHYHEVVRGRMYSNKEWMIAYFFINFIGVWAVARFANTLGFGITGWWVALALALVLDWLQGIGMMALSKSTT